MKYTNITEAILKEYKSIPAYWQGIPNTANYNQLSESELFADGWREITPASIGIDQKRGELSYDVANDNVTYSVINKTEEEIAQEMKSLVPFSISKLQAMIQLNRMGIKDAIIGVVSSSNDPDVQLYFDHAVTWERFSPIIVKFAPSIGKSDDDLDNFFIQAEKIN
jgi:hypothetical protein